MWYTCTKLKGVRTPKPNMVVMSWKFGQEHKVQYQQQKKNIWMNAKQKTRSMTLYRVSLYGLMIAVITMYCWDKQYSTYQ